MNDKSPPCGNIVEDYLSEALSARPEDEKKTRTGLHKHQLS
jgi:hypothetical protein